MRVMRILLIEGDDAAVKKMLEQSFIQPARPYESPRVKIWEIFRGGTEPTEAAHEDQTQHTE